MVLKHKRKLLILFALLIIMITTGLGCKGGSREAKEAIEKSVDLTFWGVFDSKDAFSKIIEEYRKTRPNVTITYRKLQFAEYERALLEAWAEGRGPDIFMVHNTWMGGYLNKIHPLPEKLKLPTVELTGTFQKTKTVVLRDFPSITPREIQEQFVSVVSQDAVRNGQIYGLPLSVDTLVLYYNRSLLDQAGIVSPPKTWKDVTTATRALTVYDDAGNISRAGIALGGAENINRSFDILSLLMAQNGTSFLSPNGKQAQFARQASSSVDRNYRPGQDALRFYTDFANPAKDVYTWSEEFSSDYEYFISGQLAMMLGYSYQLSLLKAQGPAIDLGIARLPHINTDETDSTGTSVNWANYWLFSMAQSSSHVNEAWDFIQYIITNPDVARQYLTTTKKPAALRSLVNEQLSDPDLSIFARQSLTAQSWYLGNQALAVEQIFKDMIKSVTSNQSTLEDAVKRAEGAVNKTLK